MVVNIKSGVPEDSKLKYAFYIPNLGGGGAEKVVYNLVDELSKRGFLIDLLLNSSKNNYQGTLNGLIRVVHLNEKGVLASLPLLVKYLYKERPKVIISSLTHTNLVTILANILSGGISDVYVCEHGINKFSVNAGLKKLINLLGILFFYRLSHRVIAVSSVVKDNLVKNFFIPSNNIVVLNNAVIPKKYRDYINQPMGHPWIKDRENTPVIVSIGRLSDEKDFATLIRSFAKLQKKISSKLIIIGTGALLENLKSLSNELGVVDRVDFCGYQENIYSWLSNSSLFVLSSPLESFGNVVVEAMAAGVPIIASDCGGPSEILEYGKYGALFGVGNVDQLYLKMIDALISQAVHPQSHKKAMCFSVEKSANDYLNLITN
jgi:glycosyltransferase involved in cell wall biosynthesis